jgi:hypothetical protein
MSLPQQGYHLVGKTFNDSVELWHTPQEWHSPCSASVSFERVDHVSVCRMFHRPSFGSSERDLREAISSGGHQRNRNRLRVQLHLSPTEATVYSRSSESGCSPDIPLDPANRDEERPVERPKVELACGCPAPRDKRVIGTPASRSDTSGTPARFCPGSGDQKEGTI